VFTYFFKHNTFIIRHFYKTRAIQSAIQIKVSLCLLVNRKDNLHLSNITFNTFGAYLYNLAKEEIPTLFLTRGVLMETKRSFNF